MSEPVKTPIWDMLKAYRSENCVRFHMPGHKGSCPASPLEAWAGIFPYDITEVPGTDNLHAPKEAILEAEALLAEAYGAQKSFLLVNGSTCGLLAAICATLKAGDQVIVDSDCHRAVWNGLSLAGAKGISTEHLTPEAVERIAAGMPDCKAVILTRPDYYGLCKDVAGIFQICRKRGLLLITDEAHGAHLAFGQASGYPVSAVQHSHITVQSAHKCLGALNQCAYLHLYGEGTAYGTEIRKWLSVFETSSPSYLLLASCDCARAYMQQYGAKGLEALRQSADWAAKAIEEKTPFRVERGADRTPDRLVIHTASGGVCGYTAELFLRKEQIQVELSDEARVVCLCTVFDTKADFEKLIAGLESLANSVKEGTLPALADFKDRQTALLALQERIGQPVSQDIVPYPPGIPLLRKGQVLTEAMYEKIAALYLAGGNLLGVTKENG